MELRIGHKTISRKSPAFFIAEIGSNHDGKLEQARELIDRCADIGADAVKFQSFSAGNLVTASHPAYSILETLSLSHEWHRELAAYCNHKGIIFLSTPFDEEKVSWLEELAVPAYKIASGDLTHYPLLRGVARTGKPIILATGIATLEETRAAVDFIGKEGNKQVAILHCVSNYPPKPGEVNVQAVATLCRHFPQNVIGLSDHSPGAVAPLAAIALGARIIEKHVTLSRSLSGPDHPYALEVAEFAAMIRQIRELEIMLGNGEKKPAGGELPEIAGARRGIYAARSLEAGSVITASDLTYLRPGTGISAADYEKIIGKKTRTAVSAGQNLTWDMINDG